MGTEVVMPSCQNVWIYKLKFIPRDVADDLKIGGKNRRTPSVGKRGTVAIEIAARAALALDHLPIRRSSDKIARRAIKDESIISDDLLRDPHGLPAQILAPDQLDTGIVQPGIDANHQFPQQRHTRSI